MWYSHQLTSFLKLWSRRRAVRSSNIFCAGAGSVGPTCSFSSAIGCDQLDAIVMLERLIERIRVLGIVFDKPRRELVRVASCQNKLHNLALGR